MESLLRVKNVAEFPTGFVVTATSFLVGCYAIWVYQGCSPIPPFISHFASGQGVRYYNCVFPLLLISICDPILRSAVLRRMHADTLGNGTTSHAVLVLNSLFFILNVVGTLGMVFVIYFPWNSPQAIFHFIAAGAGIASYQGAQVCHILGTYILWTRYPHRWAHILKRQIMIAGTTFVFPLGLASILPFFITDNQNVISNVLLLLTSFQDSHHLLKKGQEEFLAFCQQTSFAAVGMRELQYFEYIIIFYEWLIFIEVATFVTFSTIESSIVCHEKKEARTSIS